MKHYKQGIEPIELILRTNMHFVFGNIFKYIYRYENKGGVIDLDKAISYIDYAIKYNIRLDFNDSDYFWFINGNDFSKEKMHCFDLLLLYSKDGIKNHLNTLKSYLKYLKKDL